MIRYPTTLGGPAVTGCFLSGGTCSVNVVPDFVPAGTDGITAWWNGNSNYQDSSGNTTVTVTQGTSTTALTNASTITATLRDNGVADPGQAVSFTTSPAGETFTPTTCTMGTGGACSVTFTVSTAPSSTTTYTVTAGSDGVHTTVPVTYDAP